VSNAAEFRRVRRWFGDVAALDGLSLGIPADALTAVLGPSGSGKTTLLRVLAGLDDPDDGEVFLGDHRVASPRPEMAPEARGGGFVFQDQALWPHMTVAENIGFPLEARGMPARERAAAVEEAAARFEIAHRLAQRPGTLSGGERQRVALARAVVARPRVLLLDEPFAGLDAVLRFRLLEVVAEVRAALRIAAVLVTHDQGEALGAADRVVVLRDGRVVQEGAPREIYDEPRSRFVASFVGLATFLEGDADGGGSAGTALGRVPVRAGVAAGPVLLAVRPEDLRIDPDGPLRGVAGRALFRGDSWILGVRCGSERLLVRADSPPAPDAPVSLSFVAPSRAVERDAAPVVPVAGGAP
jgi:ABC-type Fe3+/spermidine/putrescine transport system ATPase subunit